MRTLTNELRARMGPADVLRLLLAGNARFADNLKANRDLQQQVQATAKGQFPAAVVLSCMDSRTSPELIFDQGLGDLFSIRVAGNVVGRDVLGSMEYAVAAAGAKLLLVLGHTACGAVAGACNGTELGHLTGLLEKIRPAIGKAPALNGDRQAWHDAVAEANVCLAIEEVRRRSPLVRERLDRGLLGLAGAMYNVGTGRVEVLHACAHVRQAAPGAAALL